MGFKDLVFEVPGVTMVTAEFEGVLFMGAGVQVYDFGLQDLAFRYYVMANTES